MIKTIVLLPYCPLPIDSGAKVEMWKHLNVLNSIGACKIVSARRRPVGTGWDSQYISEIRSLGFDLVFRDDMHHFSLKRSYGIGYGLICKALHLERAFGHSNPYHRNAFPKKWWRNLTRGTDLAVVNYSFWAHLPSTCAKVVVLHDLISTNTMEGPRRETLELKRADLVVVISKDEEDLLNRRGISQTLWSPPAISSKKYPLSFRIGLVGSDNAFNKEGIRWLNKSNTIPGMKIHVYGKLSRFASLGKYKPVGSYTDNFQPYRDCGIILIPTAAGTGVQIKAIEALAAGRAIIARKGAMRGIPQEGSGWIEVSTPDEMLQWAMRLVNRDADRAEWASRAECYYHKYLLSDRIATELSQYYLKLATRSLPGQKTQNSN